MVNPSVRHFVVRDVLGRLWVRYQAVVEDFNSPQVVVARCAHKHRTVAFAEACAKRLARAYTQEDNRNQ